MYYIYDEWGNYICKTDSFFWAKRMADFYEGFAERSDPFDGTYIVYDTMDYYYDESFFR